MAWPLLLVEAHLESEPIALRRHSSFQGIAGMDLSDGVPTAPKGLGPSATFTRVRSASRTLPVGVIAEGAEDMITDNAPGCRLANGSSGSVARDARWGAGGGLLAGDPARGPAVPASSSAARVPVRIGGGSAPGIGA